MQVTLHARVPADDAAQRLLYASEPASKSASVFPGGHFRSEADITRRLAYLDRRASNTGFGVGGAAAPVKPAAFSPSQLQDFLRHENAFAPLTPEQRANLDAAASDETVYMLTGQQPGLFGGPILWYYKALTCAALAKEWAAKLGRPVIPIFWAAGDDSDLQECNHIEWLDENAETVPPPWSLDFPDAKLAIPMSERKVDAYGLAGLLARLEKAWGAETIEGLRRCYPTPSTLTSGFLRLAQTHLGREGILFVDGYSRNLRAAARPVLESALLKWEAYQQALREGTAAMEAAGLKAQVPLREGVVHAFALMPTASGSKERHRLFGERPKRAVTKSNQDVSGNPGVVGNLNVTGHTDVTDDFRIYTAEQPQRNLLPDLASLELTHDVFTRPLVADAIFPVLGHVLGPAELRYFGQMSRLFLERTGDMPLVHPRMTAVAAPRAAVNDFGNEELDYAALIRLTPSALRARLTERVWRAHPAATALSAAPAERWLDGLRKVHARHFRDAGPMERFERTLGLAWKRYVRTLERMAFAGTAEYKAKLFHHLRGLGNGMGQDRHLNLPSLLDAIGKDGLAALRAAADPACPDIHLFLYDGER